LVNQIEPPRGAISTVVFEYLLRRGCCGAGKEEAGAEEHADGGARHPTLD
jgi:hypothetical protein